ncbi:hypothetical protein C7B64_04915 [Merismopedia glauca CCAP 1448/3]|uniref:Uncharacterized protein n=1 Tax=Merismopedia glauca CCAP 1448/3 TaxID=1296344 RepID=A0A2T1C7S1_9CYAN|nr:hypothetical protein C7B64_04915 [Merismopedia glauca CCAP 1448/3]
MKIYRFDTLPSREGGFFRSYRQLYKRGDSRKFGVELAPFFAMMIHMYQKIHGVKLRIFQRNPDRKVFTLEIAEKSSEVGN